MPKARERPGAKTASSAELFSGGFDFAAPSYFYHHTVPFEADGTRISIAFDLMPA